MSPLPLSNAEPPSRHWSALILPDLALMSSLFIGLWFVQSVNYLLFHTIVEFFSIALAVTAFCIVWNTQTTNQSPFLAYLGLSFPAAAIIDMLHALAFHGMNVFPDGPFDLPTQLWLCARVVQTLNFLGAVVLATRPVPTIAIVLSQIALVGAVLVAVFVVPVVPLCLVPGEGLTTFKVASEFAVSGAMLVVCAMLYARRRQFDPSVFALVFTGFLLLVPQEMAFTLYADPSGVMNALGHFIKILSCYLIYKAIIVTGLRRPMDLMFRRLRLTEDKLRGHLVDLEAAVAARTAALRDSEARLRALLECASDWFWETDQHGRFTRLSARVSETTGSDGSALLGRWMADLLDPGRGGEDFPALMAAMDIGEPFRRLSFPVATGERPGRWLLVSGVPIFDNEGRFLGYRGTASDTTEHHRSQDAARQKQTLAALGGLVGGLAHEVNNLLQPIVSLSDLARARAGDNAKLVTYLNVIHDSGMKARTIMHDVLAFARMEAASTQPGDVAEAVRSSLALAQPMAHPGVEIRHTIGPGLCPVGVTPTELSQLLLNLMRNAVDAMPAGGTLSIAADALSPPPPPPAGRREASAPMADAPLIVRLTVSDTGMGMDEATRGRVFEPFFTTKPVGRGTGLGLSVVYGIVQNAGGVVSIDSAIGRGTIVTIELPAATGISSEDQRHGEHSGG
jgi:PAS domain S-box-containing protein